MLCKRFKETTQRKWPYRYVTKIEKVMQLLEKENYGDVSRDKTEKLNKLKQEHETCLLPVKLRIYASDKSSIAITTFTHKPTENIQNSNNQLNPTQEPYESLNNSAYVKLTEEIPSYVLESLRKLKSIKP